MTDKLDLKSLDIVSENIEKIAALFPNCVTETANGLAIDFDLLKQELSQDIVEGNKERYRLEWPGKKEAIVTANTPTTKTLRPVREDSVDFDTTQNIYIEGDNLEVLKLLQESYLGKIKMIYIDPPYNTGKDFIYKDNFTQQSDEFKEQSGQMDEYNQRLVVNPETSGRYHSDWLSMIYPRLKLARNLLKDDGVIFTSINDREFHNLKKVFEEIFGEENFIGTIVWKNVTDNNPSNIAIEHEYILAFSKSKMNLEPVWKSKLSDVKDLLIEVGDRLCTEYSDQQTLQKKYSEWFRDNKSQLWPLENYKFIDSQGVYSGERGVHNPGKEGYRYDIIHPITKKPCKQPLFGYRFPKDTMKKMIDEGRIIFGEDEDKLVEIKVYAKDYMQKLSSVLNLDGRSGTNELKDLFPEISKIFTNPKTINLLTELISFASRDGDIVLDFFGGSSSTAHSIFKLNAETEEKRQFILVQFPENNFTYIDGKMVAKQGTSGEAFKAGYMNICEIGKERIRRVGEHFKKHLNSAETKHIGELKFESEKRGNIDFGFRVFRLSDSNMKDVFYRPQDIRQDQLDMFADNVKDDRSGDDLLLQILLDWGLSLSLSISQLTISGKQVFKVADNSLMACFDIGINETFAKEIATHAPLRVVFKDASFIDNSAKENVKQLLKQLSPNTEMKVI